MAGSSSSSPPSSGTPAPPSTANVSPSSPPPSAPASLEGRRSSLKRPGSRGPRLEYLAAFAVGLLLVGVQVFFWRRHGASASSADVVADAGAADAGIVVAADAGAAAMPAVVVTELRVLECHDRGSKRTPPEECDHLPPIEQAFVKAIEQNAACAPPSTGGGSVTYTLDFSFLRKRTPFYFGALKEGRTLKSPKAVVACLAAFKRTLAPMPIEGIAHGHARYKMSVVATYPGTLGTTDPGAQAAPGGLP
jgi:hypothetical protein